MPAVVVSLLPMVKLDIFLLYLIIKLPVFKRLNSCRNETCSEARLNGRMIPLTQRFFAKRIVPFGTTFGGVHDVFNHQI